MWQKKQVSVCMQLNQRLVGGKVKEKIQEIAQSWTIIVTFQKRKSTWNCCFQQALRIDLLLCWFKQVFGGVVQEKLSRTNKASNNFIITSSTCVSMSEVYFGVYCLKLWWQASPSAHPQQKKREKKGWPTTFAKEWDSDCLVALSIRQRKKRNLKKKSKKVQALFAK